MIYLYSLTLGFLFFLLTSLSIDAQTITWQRTYGSTISDKGHSIVQTSDNGFIICSSQLSQKPTRISRIDRFGNELWSLNEPGRIYERVIRDNNFFITVGMFSNTASAVKFDLTGKKIWNRAFGVKANGLFCDAIITTDSNYLFAGLIYESGNIPSLYLVKTDSSGSVIWQRTIDSVTSCVKVVELSDKGYLISSKESPVSAFANTSLQSLNFESKTIITDSLGYPLYTKSGIGTNGIQNLYGTGNVLIENIDTMGTVAIKIIRTDEILNVISSSLIAMPGRELLASCLIHDGLSYIVGGQSISYINADQDPYLIRFNDSDKIIMTAKIPVRPEFNEYIIDIINCTDKGFLGIGAASPFIGDNVDILAIKTDSLGNTLPVSINSQLHNENGYSSLFQNFPNPFNSKTVIKFELNTDSYIDLSIFDLLGRKVLTLKKGNAKRGVHIVSLDASQFPSGCFLYSLLLFNNSECPRGCIFSRTLNLIK